MQNKVNGELVYPSTPLNVIEEFLPGENTYVDETGWIRSGVVGRPAWDTLTRTVRIQLPKPRKYVIPRENTMVVGVVQNVRPDFLLATVVGVYENRKIAPTGPFAGFLHVSQASQEYVKSLYDLFAVGDVILAKALNGYNPYHLSTKSPGLGVILSSCGHCGFVLTFQGGRLVCPRCGSSFNRLISKSYYNVLHIKR